jgi:DNA-binding transcriptional ArsR family regulator
MNNKDYKMIEDLFKILASDARLKIIYYLYDSQKSNVKNISNELGCNIKTLSQHVKKLYSGGIVNRLNKGREVELSLSDKGYEVIKLINTNKYLFRKE